VQTHEEKDNFDKDKPENKYVTTRSDEMTKFIKEKQKKGPLAYRTKEYDDDAIESVLADRFNLRNCRVCSATLEFRVRYTNPKDPSNDTIKAGLAPFYLSQPYGKIFFSASIWPELAKKPAKDDPYMKVLQENKNTKVITLTLSDAALKELNIYLAIYEHVPTYLDVLGEDDTNFDYMTLRVWYY
jgi:hypothetical protein